MLAQLTYIVDATSDLRDQIKQRQAAAPGGKMNDQLKEQLNALNQKLEEFRSTLVSIKEGGMITGEKKLREYLGELYGSVNGYSGRPTQSQTESTALQLKKLDDAGTQFKSITTAQVPALNAALQGSQQSPLTVTSRDDWDKKQK
jgi:hypothetical protein